MKENSYRKLMNEIHTPAGLNDRVLFAARQRTAERETEQARRTAPRRRRPVLRAAVCAACALALVAGTFTLRPAEDGGVPVPRYSFALTACAADAGEQGINGAVVLSAGGTKTEFTVLDQETMEKGRFSEARFRISGEGIETVSLSIDRGGLYRKTENGAPEGVGPSIEEAYDPAVSYGFWTRPTQIPKGLLERVELNGGLLVIAVTFADGRSESRTYRLTAGEDGILAEPVTENGAPEEISGRRFQLLPYGGDQEKAQENASRGQVFFSNGNWAGGSEDGKKLSQIFRIQGEGIKTVSASMNKGAFWRGYIYAAEDEKSVPNEITLSRKLFGVDPEGCGVQGRYLTLEWNVENGFTEEYDPRFCYGLRILPEEVEAMEAAEEYQSPFTFFDGAVLSITVTFDDGTAETQNYCLRADLFQGTRDEETGLYVDLTEELDPEQADNWFKGIQARRLEWPVQGGETMRLSNGFGGRWKPGGKEQTFHGGIDIPAAEGTLVLAAADGTVLEVGSDAERGNYLVLDHGDGLTTLYGQCRNVDVKQGDTVKAGEMVGAVGATGMATGPHLHFEARQDGKAGNPVAYFDSATRATLRAE